MPRSEALLGLRLDGATGPSSRFLEAETSRFDHDESTDPLASGYPALLATLVELLTLPTPDVQAAIQCLADNLELEGIALVESHQGQKSTVLASTGDLPFEAIQEGLIRNRSSRASASAPERLEMAGLVGFSHRPQAAGPSRALLARSRSENAAPMPLLEAALRILSRLDPGATELSELQTEAKRAPSGQAALRFPPEILPGTSPAVLELYQQMRHALRGDSPVLILGETGAGKEHVAATLHLSSERASGPFVAINCAAIPADLLEAELFGIGRGVATGVDARTGEISRAQGGTLFLDEIGEIPLHLQAKLLRVLQERQVRPVGMASRPVDVRVVAATNADLHDGIRRGEFRSDLFYRLAGFELEVPALRARREDLAPLIATFVERYGIEASTRVRGVSVRALALLCAYDWPGNVRELQHEIRRCVFRCPDGQAIESSMLSARLRGAAVNDADLEALPGSQAPTGHGEEAEALSLEERVDELQLRLIRRALTATGGNQTRAAERLAVSRSGLIKRMKRLRIDPSSP